MSCWVWRHTETHVDSTHRDNGEDGVDDAGADGGVDGPFDTSRGEDPGGVVEHLRHTKDAYHKTSYAKVLSTNIDCLYVACCACERRPPSTHSIDARQLLGELQHDGDEEGLSVGGRAEELRDGHLLLLGHLGALLLHLLHVFTHVLAAAQTHQCCQHNRDKKWLRGPQPGSCRLRLVQ